MALFPQLLSAGQFLLDVTITRSAFRRGWPGPFAPSGLRRPHRCPRPCHGNDHAAQAEAAFISRVSPDRMPPL